MPKNIDYRELAKSKHNGLDTHSRLLSAAAHWAGYAAIVGAQAHGKGPENCVKLLADSAENQVFTAAIQYAVESLWQENLHPEIKKYLEHYLTDESKKYLAELRGRARTKASSTHTTGGGRSRRTTTRASTRRTSTSRA